MPAVPPPPGRFRNWVRRRYRRDDQGISRAQVAVLVGAALLVLAPLVVLPLFLVAGPAIYNSLNSGGRAGCGSGNQPGQSGTAKGDIPRDYLELYKKAGEKFGLPWNVLAGIGKEETNHGRSGLPGVHGGENYAGAGGPMQFLAATFNAYAVDGNNDGKKDRYNPADAIFTAAKYLEANGAPDRTWNAIWHYNHASWYVDDVLTYAKHYASGDFTVGGDAAPAECTDKLPANASAAVKSVIKFARQQLGSWYLWGGTGPDRFDCSGLTMRAYQSVGVTEIPRTSQEQWRWGPKIKKGKQQPGDLVFFGSPAGPHHVGLVIGNGKMIEAPHTGAQVRISSYKRPDIIGFTRPLAHKGVKPKA